MKFNRLAPFTAVIILLGSQLDASSIKNTERKTTAANLAKAAGKYLPIYRADFWINQLENPDDVILLPEQIKELNSIILDENDEMANVAELERSVSNQDLAEWLLYDPIPQDKKMFDRKAREVKQDFYKSLISSMNIEAVKESNEITFGVIIKRADIRAFPTDESVLKDPSAKDFDAFQYSAIYPPQPVALLHKSVDGKWGFFQTPFVRGWIKMADIAFAKTRADIKNDAEKFVIVTGNRIKVFGDKKNKKVVETVPMGTNLPLQGEDKNFWIVRFPQKAADGFLKWIDAYIEKKSDVHIGPLAYTKRNVINQAFKMLGEGYGWGGRGGLRDCSSFIKDIFAAMGITLPRQSNRQAAVGIVLADLDDESASPDEIEKAMNSAVPGITLFGLHGHIMLYLGNINGSYYTLHQFFGYHDKDGFRTINKAVVTNLELGKGSNMGAIKDRIKSVNLIVLDGAN